jgi:hypothetical protein
VTKSAASNFPPRAKKNSLSIARLWGTGELFFDTKKITIFDQKMYQKIAVYRPKHTIFAVF